MVPVALVASFDLYAPIIAQEGWGLPKSHRQIVSVAQEHRLLPAAWRRVARKWPVSAIVSFLRLR